MVQLQLYLNPLDEFFQRENAARRSALIADDVLMRVDLRKNGPFLSFRCVCPEPVLVKCSFLYINGADFWMRVYPRHIRGAGS
jgi:hypothetical protein